MVVDPPPPPPEVPEVPFIPLVPELPAGPEDPSDRDWETLSQTGWTFNSPYYEYDYVNTGITGTVTVDFVPYNSSVITSLSANVYPYIQVIYSSNTARIFADYNPTADITGNIIIY